MNLRTLKIIGIAIVAVLGLSALAALAYANRPIETGIVTDKAFVPAHYEDYQEAVYVYVPRLDAEGNVTMNMQFSHYETRTRHIPDKWYVRFAEGDRSRTIEVSEDRHDRYSIGDTYP